MTPTPCPPTQTKHEWTMPPTFPSPNHLQWNTVIMIFLVQMKQLMYVEV